MGFPSHSQAGIHNGHNGQGVNHSHIQSPSQNPHQGLQVPHSHSHLPMMLNGMHKNYLPPMPAEVQNPASGINNFPENTLTFEHTSNHSTTQENGNHASKTSNNTTLNDSGCKTDTSDTKNELVPSPEWRFPNGPSNESFAPSGNGNNGGLGPNPNPNGLPAQNNSTSGPVVTSAGGLPVNHLNSSLPLPPFMGGMPPGLGGMAGLGPPPPFPFPMPGVGVGPFPGLPLGRFPPGMMGPGLDNRANAEGKAKRSSKKRKKKDPNEPSRPVSAYALFFRETQANIKIRKPDATFGEISKEVARQWDALDDERKSVSIEHYKLPENSMKLIHCVHELRK